MYNHIRSHNRPAIPVGGAVVLIKLLKLSRTHQDISSKVKVVLSSKVKVVLSSKVKVVLQA